MHTINLRASAIFALAAQLAASVVMAEECAADLVGKQACRSGNTVECAKHFDMSTQSMQYSWDYVNSSGQVFQVEPKLLNSTPGYTPKPCTDKDAADNAPVKKKSGQGTLQGIPDPSRTLQA